MSATILLVRHGHHAEVGLVLSGRSPVPLDAQGRDEAARLAARLARREVAAVHSSPQVRARDTAAPMAAGHGLGVEVVDALDEIDFGAWTGQGFDALEGDPRWHLWNTERSRARPPGGESITEAVSRARRHIEGIVSDGPVVCVSHCDIIRGLVAYYLGLDWDRMLGFDVDPASVTTIQLHPGGGRIVAINERVS